MVRLIFGSDYRLLIPASALCGAIAIVLADTLARTDRVAHGIAGRRDDGHGRSARVHLFAAARAAMSAPDTFAQTAGGREDRPHREQAVRLNVEQASYAYSASAQAAPTFTLGATSFQAREREIVAILGPNASGKSTLLRLIAGTIAPLSGRVELDGEETSRLDVRTRAQRIAVVHQESPIVYPALAGDFVLQGRYPYGRALRFANRGGHRDRPQRPRAGGRGASCRSARSANFPAAKSSA